MGNVDPSTFDDEFFKKDVLMHELAFEGQMHFGTDSHVLPCHNPL